MLIAKVLSLIITTGSAVQVELAVINAKYGWFL